MSFFENTRKPQGFGGMTIYNGDQIEKTLQKAGFTDIQIHKNGKGWICVIAAVDR